MSHYSQYQELTNLKNHLHSSGLRSTVEAAEMVTLEANRPPWQSTGISLKKGQQFSLFARGRIGWSTKSPMLFGDPAFHLWARVHPNGKIFNLTGDTGSFTADQGGILQIGIYMGLWENDKGTICHTRHYERLTGAITVVVTSWKRSVVNALAEPSTLPTPPLLSLEQARLTRHYQPPTEWSYLTETGNAEIFHHKTGADGHQQISVDAVNDQGIIRYPIELPLSKDLVLSWQWKLMDHPSLGPEDRSDCHDYVSVATEFDNGRDLTWIWSQHLDTDHHFACPVKDWSKRESHYVVRNATDQRGKWMTESRRIHADVSKSQGPPPENIVAVWLIAVSTFSHGRLRADFREISFVNGDTQRVL